MSDSLLARLGATAADVARLPAAARLAAVQLLVDWGAPDEALACLEYLRRDAGAQWHLLAAEALRRAHRPAEAVALLDALLARVPDLAEAQRARLHCAAAAGDASAAQAAEALTAAAPGRADAWLLLGDVQLALNAPVNAEVAFTQAQRLRPADVAPRVGAVRAARLAGDAAQAAALALPLAAAPAHDALHPDELQIVRAALHEGNTPAASAAIPPLEQAMVARFERDLARVRALLARATPSAATNQPAHQPTNPPTHQPPGPPSSLTRHELAELHAAARRLFGFATLLPLQAEVLAATRRGEDVLAVLPTGGGKSLTYQLPAFLDEGLTLVISPLVALMQDQVNRLPPRLRAAAVALHGGLDLDETRAVMEGIAAHKYRLIFAAPERLRRRGFVEDLRHAGVTRLVVDEAHCVSAWGHDFRPDYLHVAQAHADLGAPPVLALTATAPPPVRDDILAQLFAPPRQRPLRIVLGDPARPNLWLGVTTVRDETERRARIADCCRAQAGCGLVYVRSRAQADEYAAALRAQGIEAAAYHAGRDDRAAVQERFMHGRVRVVVATIAFGMGVDKPDIRFVLHAGLPAALEGYAQEVGRAGRDGQPATCLLFCQPRDVQQAAAFAARGDLDLPLLGNLLEVIAQVVGNAAGQAPRRAAGAPAAGIVPADALAAALPAVDATTLRVALRALEEARLIERHYDAPRIVTIYLRKAARSPVFTRFLNASRLKPGSPVEWQFGDLAAAARMDVTALEPRLIEWQEQGYLRYYPSGRELMVTLRTTPRDGRARLERLLAAQQAQRAARAQAVVAYVEGTACRHAMLSEALGGPPAPPRCGHCDNCTG